MVNNNSYIITTLLNQPKITLRPQGPNCDDYCDDVRTHHLENKAPLRSNLANQPLGIGVEGGLVVVVVEEKENHLSCYQKNHKLRIVFGIIFCLPSHR